jgi:hypothetical protein
MKHRLRISGGAIAGLAISIPLAVVGLYATTLPRDAQKTPTIVVAPAQQFGNKNPAAEGPSVTVKVDIPGGQMQQRNNAGLAAAVGGALLLAMQNQHTEAVEGVPLTAREIEARLQYRALYGNDPQWFVDRKKQLGIVDSGGLATPERVEFNSCRASRAAVAEFLRVDVAPLGTPQTPQELADATFKCVGDLEGLNASMGIEEPRAIRRGHETHSDDSGRVTETR